MTAKQIERALRSMAWAAPAAGLRERVLSGARVAPRAIPLTDRIWFSRAWRLAAAAVAVALIALEQLAGSGGSVSRTVAAPIREDVAVIAEAARDAGLPADQAEVLARRMVSATERPRASAALGELGLAALGIEGEAR